LRATGITPGAAAGHVKGCGTSAASAVERLAGLARLDLGAACHRAGIEGLAADRATGNGHGAAARRVEGLATDRATGIGPGEGAGTSKVEAWRRHRAARGGAPR
jgi:hypothetical protein